MVDKGHTVAAFERAPRMILSIFWTILTFGLSPSTRASQVDPPDIYSQDTEVVLINSYSLSENPFGR